MFSTSTHYLEFSSDYSTLYVKLNSTGATVESFGLACSPYYAVTVVDNDFVIGTSVCTDCEEYVAFDIDAYAGPSFDGNRLGGIHIIDLRDTGKTGYNLDYCFEENPIGIQRTSGEFGLKLFAPYPANGEITEP